jgi:5-methylcytosine-specific restriction protein A
MPESESVRAGGTSSGRNPPWARDELILALDLYFVRGPLSGAAPEIFELNRVLNELPIHTTRPDREKFRNPNAVAMKLANYAALDPAYPGTGLQSGGRGDAVVWDEYNARRDELHLLAEELRRGALSGIFPVAAEEDEDGVAEGRLLFRLHRSRERNHEITRKKKRQVLSQTAHLACEVCGFDFAIAYGERGEGYAECHHVLPLSKAGERTTRLSDLAIVCSNCHRMLHARAGWTTPAQLRDLVVRRRGQLER